MIAQATGDEVMPPTDDDKTAEHTPLDLCNNGDCRAPQVPDCSSQFCAFHCEEKCLGNCVRAVKQQLGADTPSF